MADGRTVFLVDPDDRWRQQFQLARGEMLSIFDGDDARIEHIGSTAIGTIRSKPTLDILVGVRTFASFEGWRQALRAARYEYDANAESTEPSRKVFRRGPSVLRTEHLHVTLHGGQYWSRILAFRDYLVANCDVACEYEALKERLARQFPRDGKAYTAGKAEFVRRVEGLAIQEAGGTSSSAPPVAPRPDLRSGFNIRSPAPTASERTPYRSL